MKTCLKHDLMSILVSDPIKLYIDQYYYFSEEKRDLFQLFSIFFHAEILLNGIKDQSIQFINL